MGVLKVEQDGMVYLRNSADAPGYQHSLTPDIWAEIERQIKNDDLTPLNTEPGTGLKQPAPIFYGDGEHDYIVVAFEGGSVTIRDGGDPTGRAMQFGMREWADFVRQVKGEDGGDGKHKRGSRKSATEDGFTAGVDGEKDAETIAREKADMDDRTVEPKTTTQVNDDQPGSREPATGPGSVTSTGGNTSSSGSAGVTSPKGQDAPSAAGTGAKGSAKADKVAAGGEKNAGGTNRAPGSEAPKR